MKKARFFSYFPKKYLFLCSALILLLNSISSSNLASSNKKLESDFNPTTSYGIHTSYKLGPGDKLYVSVFKLDGYSVEVVVLPDGNVNLPRIGSINVWGKSIDEAKNLFTNEYKKILRNPLIYVDLISARSINILISGEVQSPGLYNLSSKYISSSNLPNLTQAIQLAGGVKHTADINSIEIIRLSNDKTNILNISFLDMMTKRKPFTNPPLYDGDKIIVNKSITESSVEFQQASRSSLAPEKISIDVIGEVVNPGAINLPPNTNLLRAIQAAGGFTRRAKRSNIYIYSSTIDGKTKVSKVNLLSQSKKNTSFPIVFNRDAILVPPNSLARTSDSLNTIIDPIKPIINASALIKLLGN